MKKRNLLKVLSIMLLTMLFVSQAKAQEITVTGTVNDSFGPVIGASVLAKGTTNGCITDLDGKFTLTNVSAKGTLVVSFVGYKTLEIPVNNQKVFTIDIKEDAQQLQEVTVVAVGYGDVKRRDLTGSIGKADMKDLTKTPVNNVAESLGGRVAGVQVSSGDGGLGDNFNIVIRGAGSLTQDTSPLYVIDGFPSETSGMGALNPNDIESIDILKDASATAIYGSRGANGVIIITTKKGKTGKAKVSYNGSVSFSKVRNTMDLMNAYDFVRMQQEIMEGETKTITGPDGAETTIPMFDYYYLQNGLTLEDYKTIKQYDWQDEIYRTAISHNHHVALNGGTEKMDYAASLSYSNQQGVIVNSELSRYQGRININQRINKSVKINASANYASVTQYGANPSINQSQASNSLLYSVWGYRPASPSGTDLLENMYDEDVDMNGDYRFNPVKTVKNEYRRKTTNTLQANLGVEWEIIKNLKLKVSAGYTGRDYIREDFNGSETRTGNSHPNNKNSRGINAYLYESENKSYLNENTLSYVFSKKKHNINALVGITFQKNTSYYHDVQVNHITSEKFGMSGLGKGDTPSVTASKGENKLMSYLGRINYNYASKYYATFSMRADGSSKFAKGNRWGYFPSGSLAWAFQREKFVEETLPWLSNGKLRISYGLTGNNRIGDFDYLAQLEASGDKNDEYKYTWNGKEYVQGAYINSIAVPNLKWETTEQYDFGLDLGFFDGRLNVNLDYYIKNTKDLLIWADTPASSGYAKTRLNMGELQNKGFEVTIESTNIKTKNFTWNTSFNIAFNKNEIKSLNYGQTEMIDRIQWDKGYEGKTAYVSRVGEAAGKMFGFIYDGTYKEEDFNITEVNGVKKYELKPGIAKFKPDCRPGDPKYKNIDGSEDNLITNSDRTTIGNGHPLHTGGLTNNFTYKNWDLNIFFQWSYGNDIFNINRMVMENPGTRRQLNQFASYNNRWSPSNPTSNIPRVRALGADEYSTLYVEDGSFLKLKTIAVGYNFDSKKIKKFGLSAARIFLSAENIATFTSYSGSDPEVSTRHSVTTPGFDWSAYPRAFSASLGLNVTF